MLCFDLRKKVKGENTSSSESEITLLLVVEVSVEKDGCISEKTLDIKMADLQLAAITSCL